MIAATMKDKYLRRWIKRKERMPKPFQYTEKIVLDHPGS